MNLRTIPMAVILMLALVLALPQGASAEAVGHFTQVQGRVDLLKGGKLPATPVKVGDGVEEGDVLRAKSLSKAQITFVDQTTLTISPESRIAIEKFMFDGAKGKRSALVQVFQGMVLAVVSKIYQTEQPDFVVKTHTAIMGIRGTQVGIHITANSSQFLNFQGITRVSSNFAEVPGHVDLHAMEATEVLFGKTPMLKYELHLEDQKFFMMRMNVAAVKPQAQAAVCSAGSPAASACTPGAAVASSASAATSSGAGLGSSSTGSAAGSGIPGGGITIVPQIPQLTQVAQVTLQTFSFTETFSGSIGYNLNPSPGNNSVGNYVSTTLGSGTRTGVYPGAFSASFNIVATDPTSTLTFSSNSGDFTIVPQSISGRVTGTLGQALSGTMNMRAYTSGNTYFTLSGLVTLQPNGNLTFTTNGTFAIGTFPIAGISNPNWTTSGSFDQTMTPPASSPLSSTPTSLTQTSSTPPTLTQTSLTAATFKPQTSTAPISTTQVSALKK